MRNRRPLRTTFIFYLSISLLLLTFNQTGISETVLINRDNDVDYWGVIIGISDYKDTGNDLPVSSIHLKKLYHTLLSSSNWDENHIMLLINKDATYQNILSALDWLVNQSDDNDIVLFSFQGHGSSIEDTNSDEIDGYDEGIVAWEGLPGLIIDDVLDRKFDNISCDGMFLIIHSCLSGGLLDDMQNECHYSSSLQTDLSDSNRVIIVSSQDQGLALAFPSLTRQLSAGLQGPADTNTQNNQGDGIITAEEAADFTRNRINTIILGLILIFPPIILSLLLSEIISKILHGYWILPFPIIDDNYTGDLPIYYP